MLKIIHLIMTFPTRTEGGELNFTVVATDRAGQADSQKYRFLLFKMNLRSWLLRSLPPIGGQLL